MKDSKTVEYKNAEGSIKACRENLLYMRGTWPDVIVRNYEAMLSEIDRLRDSIKKYEILIESFEEN
jgi:hypothetical protein